jgi:uncharacterized protein YbjT (DUF2867 family)
MHSEDLTLIMGGTGNTGRRVAERSRAAGRPVRVGSRSGEPPFDWEDRSTWAGALYGPSAVYIPYFPDVAVPGAPEALEAFAHEALASGARRLALLSGRGAQLTDRAQPRDFGREPHDFAREAAAAGAWSAA